MDFKLNDSQRQYVEAVRALAQNDFKPRAAKYMDGTFPWDNMKQLAEIGVLGMTVSEQYGGLGLPVFETALILEEIAMNDDDPGDIVHDELAAAVYGDSPLGRPILGTAETIAGISRTSINNFYRRRYRPEAMVVAAAGHVDHDQVVSLVRRAFADVLDPNMDPVGPRTARAQTFRSVDISVVSRPTEQAHLVLGVPGLPRNDSRRYALSVLTAAFGGGMSSRLFQEIREKRGLAYSVYAYAQGFNESGLYGIYVGCLPAKVDTALDVCRTEIDRLVRDGLTHEELQRGKGQVKGATVLGQEDTGARMTRIGKSELHVDPLLSLGELLDRIESVTLADVAAVAADLLSQPPTLAVIGPFDGAQRFRS
jgi:predicted Zn-dependent peptidase